MLESLYNQVAGLAQGLELDYKDTATQVFLCKIYEIFQMTYFEEHLRTTASETTKGIFSNISTAKFMLSSKWRRKCSAPDLYKTKYCILFIFQGRFSTLSALLKY